MENTNLTITLSPDGYYTFEEKTKLPSRKQVIKLLQYLRPELKYNTIQTGITSLLNSYYRLNKSNFEIGDYTETGKEICFTKSGIDKIANYFKVDLSTIQKDQ